MKHFTLPPRTSTYGLAIRSCWPKCSWPTHPTGQMGGMWGSQLGSSSKSLWAQKPCSKTMVKGYLASAHALQLSDKTQPRWKHQQTTTRVSADGIQRLVRRIAGFAKHQNSGIWTHREPEFISLPEQPNMG